MTSILKADTIQDTDGNNIINENSNTITIGASGDTTNIIGTLQNNGAAVGGTNTPYFEAYMAADQTLSDASYTKLTFNTETYDSAGNYDHSTNYRFTPQTSGKYLIYFTVTYSKKGVDAFHNVETQIRFNGSAHKKYYMDFYDNYTPYAITTNGQAIMNFNGSSDYVELFGYFNVTSGTGDVLSAAHSAFGGFKLVE